MFVTDHARARIEARLGYAWADSVTSALESLAGQTGKRAYHVATLPSMAYADDGSNGDHLVVVADEGSVITVMLRRSWDQPFRADALGVASCHRFLMPRP